MEALSLQSKHAFELKLSQITREIVLKSGLGALSLVHLTDFCMIHAPYLLSAPELVSRCIISIVLRCKSQEFFMSL